MVAASVVLGLALVLAVPSAASAQEGNPVVPNCELISIEDLQVPASEAGVLESLKVKEGSRVTKGMELGRIDDREIQAQLSVKKLEYEAAKQEADSDIQVRYAAKESDVNKTQYHKLLKANETTKSAVAEIDVIKAKFEWEKSKLNIEKAQEKHATDGLTAQSKKAEVEAAEVAVDRRILKAPFPGTVVKVYRNVGEWASPGDGIVRIVRIDRLRVGANLDATKWTPSELENRKVTVEVKLTRDRPPVKVQGQVVYVSPVVQAGQVMEVLAEIETPMDDQGRPLVRAGLQAEMTIHVDQPPIAADKQPPVDRRAARKG